MDSYKLALITTSLILVTGTVSAIDINSSQKLNYYNDGNLEFSVDTNGVITAKGPLNMNSNQIAGANIDSTSQVDDGAIPDVETLSFSSRFAGNQIPWSSVDQNLNLNSQNIQNINQLEGFFQSACPSGEVIVDVSDSGNFVCTNVTSEVSGAYVNRNGDSMTGALDMNSNSLLNVGSLTGSNIVNSDNIASGAVNSNELNETDSYSLDWSNLALSKSDVSKSDVGLGNARNVDLANTGGAFIVYDTTNEEFVVQPGSMTWSDLGISQSDVSKTDVGLGNVENVAISNANWSDINIGRSDVSVSDLGAADANLDMNGNSLTNYYGSACPSGQAVVDVNNNGNFLCADLADEVSGTYVNKNGDSMSGDLDMSLNGNNAIVGLSNLGGVDIVNGSNIESNSISSSELDESASYNLDWSNLALSRSDVSKSDVGLGSVRNVDLANTGGAFIVYDTTNEQFVVQSGSMSWSDLGISQSDISKSDVNLGSVENIALSGATWTDMGISKSDVSKSDVGMGNVENIALSSATWSDIGVAQSDVSVSDLGAADANLDMNGNSLTNYFGSSCGSGYVVVDVTDNGTLQCVDISGEVSTDYVSRSGDSMSGNLDLSGNQLNNVDWANSDNPNTDSQSLGTSGNQITLGNGGSVTAPYSNNADQVDGVQLANIGWADTSMSQSDVSKSDVGLGSVENVALSTATWADIGISQSDVSKSDVGLGNVENVALSTAGWSDIGISQSDVLSTANDLDSNGNLQSNSVGQNELDQSNIDCSGAYC